MKEMTKKQSYVRPEISVIEISACTLLAGSDFDGIKKIDEGYIDDSDEFC